MAHCNARARPDSLKKTLEFKFRDTYHDESILYGVIFFGALSLKMTANLLSVKCVNSNLRPICSEFHDPFSSQLVPSAVPLHCFDILIISSSSRIWSRIERTVANSPELLFVTALELAAGRPSNVLFMNVFDKSLSTLLLLLAAAVAAVDGRGWRKEQTEKNKTINFRFNVWELRKGA